MAYDLELAGRIRLALAGRRGISEKRMFGGIAFLHRGNMCCGVVGDELMIRVGREAYAKTVALKHAHPMDFTGRPMTGFVYVRPAGFATRAALEKWLDRALAFAGSLPAK